MPIVVINNNDYNQIIENLKIFRSLDLSDYFHSPLRHAFERSMLAHGIVSTKDYIERIKKDNHFFETLQKEIAPESSEMFRDPTFWKQLRDKLLTSFNLSGKDKIKILLPNCVGGDELFTLMIVLKEMKIEDRVEINAFFENKLLASSVQNGTFKALKIKISLENYKNFGGTAILEDYFITSNGVVTRNKMLLTNVHIKVAGLLSHSLPTDNHIILFRNKLLYVNAPMQERWAFALKKLVCQGGILAIGIREKLPKNILNDFQLINAEESIYKKK